MTFRICSRARYRGYLRWIICVAFIFYSGGIYTLRSLHEHKNLVKNKNIAQQAAATRHEIDFLQAKSYEMDETSKPKFLKDFKNPCFYRNDFSNLTAKTNLSCLPYFFCAGWTKAASTDFWYRLKTHAHIRTGVYKELNWWNMGKPQSLEMRSYIQYFQKDADELSIHPANWNQTIIGDFTPQYSWDNDRFQMDPKNYADYPYPYSLTPHRIKSLLPHAKMIFIIRNPIDLIFSDYKFFGAGEKSAEDFHLQISNAIRWWELCVNLHSYHVCSYGSPTGLPPLRRPQCELKDVEGKGACLNLVWNSTYPAADRLRIALYNIHLRQWLDNFHRSQLLLLSFSEYVKEPIGYVAKHVLPFLGLRNFTEEEISSQKLFSKTYGVMNRNVYHRELRMLPETKYLLDNFFGTFNFTSLFQNS